MSFLSGVPDEQFKYQMEPVLRLFWRQVIYGGSTPREAYYMLVRRFPEAIRKG